MESSNSSDLDLCLKQLRNEGFIPQIYTVPNSHLEKIELKIRKRIEQTLSIAKELDIAVGIVGGFVRDLVLGMPSHDIDFVVFNGNLVELTNEIARCSRSKIGKMSNKTLTTQIRFPDGVIFEFNSTRKEEYEFPNRVPKVSEGSILDDLTRRDFTINAFILFADKYLDLFGGKEDLDNQIIDTTREPEIVFREDYLRMLRAVRFAAKLDFHITERVRDGIKLNAKNITLVPKDRIFTELKESMQANPIITFKNLRNLKLLKILFPKLRNKTLGASFKEKDTWNKIEHKLDFLYSKGISNSNMVFATILIEMFNQYKREIGSEHKALKEIEKFLIDFKFSNKEKNEILFYIQNHDVMLQSARDQKDTFEVRKILRKLGKNTSNVTLLSLSEASARSDDYGLNEYLDSIKDILTNRSLVDFKLQINGHEIQELFNSKGREIENIKNALINAIICEEIENKKEDCIKYIKRKLL